MVTIGAPFFLADIACTDVTPSKTVVGQGYSLNINVTVANHGSDTENFNVTAYVNSGQAINNTGLVGYWKFDEGLGTMAYDSSGYNNNGTIYGANYTIGKIKGALEFDGADDYVYVPPSEELDIVKELALEAWVKLDRAPPGNAILVFKTPDTSGYNLMQYGMDIGGVTGFYERRIAFYVSKTTAPYWHSVISNQALDIGKWYHIVATYSSSDYKVTIYINGAKDIEADFPIDIDSHPSDPVLIGGRKYTDYAYFMPGIIDEVKIYNRTLSAEEVLAEYLRAPLATQKVILSSGSSSTLTFTWNTTGFAKGNYTIWAYAWPVLSEIDKADNNCTGGIVHVGIPGDIDGKGSVDPLDLGMMGAAWGAFTGESNYNPNADLDGDGCVGPLDLGIMGAHWGEFEP
jgi:hypothetical protein